MFRQVAHGRLEHHTDNVKVEGSTPSLPTSDIKPTISQTYVKVLVQVKKNVKHITGEVSNVVVTKQDVAQLVRVPVFQTGGAVRVRHSAL